MGREVDNSSAATHADRMQETIGKISQDGYQNNDVMNACRLANSAPDCLPQVDLDFGSSDGCHTQPKLSSTTDGGKAKSQNEIDGKAEETDQKELEECDDDSEETDQKELEECDDDDHEEESGEGCPPPDALPNDVQGDASVDVSVIEQIAANAAAQAAIAGASQDAATGVGIELGLSIIQAIGARGGLDRGAATQASVNVSVFARQAAAAVQSCHSPGAAGASGVNRPANGGESSSAKNEADFQYSRGPNHEEDHHKQPGPVDENGTPLRPLPNRIGPSDGSREKPGPLKPRVGVCSTSTTELATV